MLELEARSSVGRVYSSWIAKLVPEAREAQNLDGHVRAVHRYPQKRWAPHSARRESTVVRNAAEVHSEVSKFSN